MQNVLRISGVILLVLTLFFIHSCKKENKTLPVISTTGITEISQTTAIAGGDVTEKGSDPILFRGVCWDTTKAPTISNNKTIVNSESPAFASSITGLEAGKEYYVRAYATNSLGTAYGNEIFFKAATAPPSLPSVSTFTNIPTASTTATCGGFVTADGGSPVTARGVCWNTTGTPTIANSKTSNGTGTGSFSSPISGLIAGTTYYVRAYATNKWGTAYGNLASFTTTIPPSIVTVVYIAPSSITTNSAVVGGNITSTGGQPIVQRAIQYWCATPQSSPITLIIPGYGPGPGIFQTQITGLLPNREYHYIASATNSVGSGGRAIEVVFRTLPAQLPVLSTTIVSSIATTTAISGGNITADGGSAVTARGVCWSTTGSPTTANSKTSNGTGTGAFTSSITGLTPGTTYYVRAYATNSTSTGYGNEYGFATQSVSGSGTVTDVEGNVYKTIKIGSQTWMAENLKTTRYNNGTGIPLNIPGGSLETPAYNWYNNDAATYKAAYGALYNWYAVSTTTNGGKNVCPTGWHVPTNTEWTTLAIYVGFSGGRLKEKGTTHWNTPNVGATNELGFTALPGGYRFSNGTFDGVTLYGLWWSSSGGSSTTAFSRTIYYDSMGITGGDTYRIYGYSVRCLKD